MKNVTGILMSVVIASFMVACAPKAPQLNLQLDNEITNNPKLKEFILEAQDEVNQLARNCATMHQEAKKFENVDFNTLSDAKQHRLVELSLEYTRMWFTHNVKAHAQALDSYELMMNATPEASVALSKARSEIEKFTKELVDKYGEDLKIDRTSPYFLPEKNVPVTPNKEVE